MESGILSDDFRRAPLLPVLGIEARTSTSAPDGIIPRWSIDAPRPDQAEIDEPALRLNQFQYGLSTALGVNVSGVPDPDIDLCRTKVLARIICRGDSEP